MAEQYFSLTLKGLENHSRDPVLVSIGREMKYLHSDSGTTVNLQTPDRNHAFKILMVQNNISYVFNVSKTGHVLQVREIVSEGSATLAVTGTYGKFKIRVENSGAITIEDVSDSYVLKSNGVSMKFYRFTASGGDALEVKAFNE